MGFYSRHIFPYILKCCSAGPDNEEQRRPARILRDFFAHARERIASESRIRHTAGIHATRALVSPRAPEDRGRRVVVGRTVSEYTPPFLTRCTIFAKCQPGPAATTPAFLLSVRNRPRMAELGSITSAFHVGVITSSQKTRTVAR